MPYEIPIAEVRERYPEYEILNALTPSEQKAAFRVRDSHGQVLCLKIISPDYQMDRLQRELLAMKSLKHPNIARFLEYTFSVVEAGERHHVIEEFVDGTDLQDHLGADIRWDSRRAAKFFLSLAEALEVLRESRIVHRDLKPTNVRVRENDTPSIIDFGLARHLDLPALTPTAFGARVGTPKYSSPEQFVGIRSDIDHRTDLFALGILMFEALTGAHPFFQKGMTTDQLCEAVCESETCFEDEAFLNLPAEWQALVRRLLAKQRIHRPMRAEHVAKAVANIGVES